MSPPRVLKDEGVLQLWRVFEHSEPFHAGAIAGADRTGEASGAGGTRIALGVWFDRMGRVRRVRWEGPVDQGTFIAYAELACALLESGVAPASVDAAALRRVISDVPSGEERYADVVADVVAAAVAAALCSTPLSI